MELDPNSCIIGPLSYQQTLAQLRLFMYESAPTSWSNTVDISMFTLHSLKNTFLSFAAQLSASPDSRAAQGHHAHGSVVVYSRDDVFPALALQAQIRDAVRSDWRPMVPQHRGTQSPLQALPCVLIDLIVPCPHLFLCLTSLSLLQSAANSVSPDQVDAPDIEIVAPDPPVRAASPEPQPEDTPGIRFMSAPTSRISHVMVYRNHSPKAICGALLALHSAITNSVPEGHRPCLKKGRVAVFDHYRE